MSNALFEGRCQACESGQGKLEQEQVEEGLKALPGWSLASGGQAIERTFKFDNFYQTVGFVNAVAWIANSEDHHPDLAVGYGACKVTFTTHAVGGLTKNDFICAAAVNRLMPEEEG